MRSNRLVYVVELVKTRHARLDACKQTGSRRTLHLSALSLGVVSLVAAVLALAALPFSFLLTTGLPAVGRLEELLNPTSGVLLQPVRFYDRSGETLILTLAPEGIERKFVSVGDVPWLAKAYVASNQPDFWQAGIFEWSEATRSSDTIAERTVATLLLPNEPEGWLKNLRVNLLAADALKKYGQEQILTWAINSTDFGHWAFGAESAAQLYLGKPAAELTLAESALLVAVAQAPALNPIDAPELAIRFQRLVLTSMWEQGVITDSELAEAVSQLLVFAPARKSVNMAPDFTDLAIEQLEAELGHERVISGGLDVITTLDYELHQEAASLIGEDGANLVIADPVNNRLLAVLGDAATEHQAGSVFNPFVYLGAFAQGKAPASLVWVFDQRTAASINQGPLTLRKAFAGRLSTVEASLSIDPAIERRFAELMQLLDIRFPDQEAELSLADAARVYGLLSQNGLAANIESPSLNTLLFAAGPSSSVELDLTRTVWQSVLSPDLSYLVTDVLSDTTYWQQAIDRPAAFTFDTGQHWLVAYSPQRVLVLWKETAFGDESQIWLPLFETAHRGLPTIDWEVPAGLISVIVCVPSGQLPDEDCPETRREWFLRDNRPRETDGLYQRIAINSLNGKLATVFTPEEFVEERVYLMVPPEGEAWAQAARIPIPSQDYDPVPGLKIGNSLPKIAQPAPFTEVSGLVKVIGSLGADAVRYDVQIGQGLRPSEWLLLAEGRASPWKRDLAQWDTEGLGGIWAIQLQTWNAEGKMTRVYTVVTIESEK